MKNLFVIILLASSFAVNAGMFGHAKEEIKIFKDYPFDIHKNDFLERFKYFGKCMAYSESRICAPEGYESLYGAKFNIVITLDKNKTNGVILHLTDASIARADFWELFRGLIKSGFSLYQVEDKDGTANRFDDILASAKTGQKINNVDPKLDILESKERTSQKLFYVETDKLNSILKLGQRFSSSEDIISRLPKDTRFIEMDVMSFYDQGYSVEIKISLPKLEVTKEDDRPVEKF